MKIGKLLAFLLAGFSVSRLYVDEPGAGGAPPPPPGDPETFSRAYVGELRNENKAVRLKNDALVIERDAHEAAGKKAGTDHLEAIKGVQTAADARVVRSEMKAAAVKAGMVDLDGLKLADLTKVKLNADGEVEGADELMADLKKTKPFLFGVPSTSNTNPVPPKVPPAAKSALEMTADEHKAARRLALQG